jgi:thymidylate synthase (FAD)
MSMKVEFIDKLGGDINIVNAARCSFDKQHNEFDEDTDNRLLRYLARERHWTPYAAVCLSIRITASIAVSRQLEKHYAGLVMGTAVPVRSEVSRRYVKNDPTYHIPESWRAKAESAKQGSGGDLPAHTQEVAHNVFMDALRHCDQAYLALLEAGVAPEQARLILPLATETTWIWTGSLAAFHRVCALRLDAHAQQETQQVALEIAAICQAHFPKAWAALHDYG